MSNEKLQFYLRETLKFIDKETLSLIVFSALGCDPNHDEVMCSRFTLRKLRNRLAYLQAEILKNELSFAYSEEQFA